MKTLLKISTWELLNLILTLSNHQETTQSPSLVKIANPLAMSSSSFTFKNLKLFPTPKSTSNPVLKNP